MAPLGLLGVALGLLAEVASATEAVGTFTTARCALEMGQLQKREAVRRMCQSMSNLYTQLQMVQKGERHWLGKAKSQEGSLRRELVGMAGRDARVQHELSLAQLAYSQNEKLELGLEELRQLYQHSQLKDSQDAKEAASLKRKYAEVEEQAMAEGTLAERLKAKEHKEASENRQLRDSLLAEGRKLKALQQHEAADVKDMSTRLARLQKEVVQDKGLQGSLTSTKRTSEELAHRLLEAEAEGQHLHEKLSRAEAKEKVLSDTATAATARAEALSKELEALQAELRQATARAAAAEAAASHAKQKDALACEAKVNQCYEDCTSKI